MNREAWWVIYSPWGHEEWDINHHHHHGFGSCCQSTPCPPSSPGTLDPGWHYFLPSPSSVGLILPPASHLSGYSVLLMLWLVGTYVSSFLWSANGLLVSKTMTFKNLIWVWRSSGIYVGDCGEGVKSPCCSSSVWPQASPILSLDFSFLNVKWKLSLHRH